MKYKCGALTLEDDGYCVRCGFKHTSRDLVVGKPAPARERLAPQVEIKPEPVVFPKFELKFKTYDTPAPAPKAEVKNTPASLKKLVRETMDELCDHYDLPRFSIRFTNGSGAAHKKRRDMFTGEVIKEWFVFGVPALRYIFEHGYAEYATVARRLRMKQHSIDGADGVRQLIYHEFAHVLQCNIPGGRRYNSVHNSIFMREYKRVMTDAGFDWRK